VTRLLRDRRGAFGFAVLTRRGRVRYRRAARDERRSRAQHDIVATRFIPPLSSDAHGVFHPLGTDRFGRDVWTRLVYGARISMGVGVPRS